MGRSKKRNMNNNGFTLIEMAVAMLIMAILAGIAIPAFSRWIPDYNLKNAVQDLYSNMQLAKMEAIRTKDSQIIQFFPANNTYTKADGAIVDLTSYGNGIKFGRGTATEGVNSDTGDVTYNDARAVFNMRGMMDSAEGYVYLTNSKNTAYVVGTLQSGVVVLQRWKGSGWEQ